MGKKDETTFIRCPHCGSSVSSGASTCWNCNNNVYVQPQYMYYQQPQQYTQQIQSQYAYVQPQMQNILSPRTVVCEKCNTWYDYEHKKCPSCGKAKPHSSLAVAAQILSILAFFMPLIGILGMLGWMFVIVALILSIIDLAIGDKRKRHTGAYDGIVIFVIYILLYSFGWIFLFI